MIARGMIRFFAEGIRKSPLASFIMTAIIFSTSSEGDRVSAAGSVGGDGTVGGGEHSVREARGIRMTRDERYL